MKTGCNEASFRGEDMGGLADTSYASVHNPGALGVLEAVFRHES